MTYFRKHLHIYASRVEEYGKRETEEVRRGTVRVAVNVQEYKGDLAHDRKYPRMYY